MDDLPTTRTRATSTAWTGAIANVSARTTSRVSQTFQNPRLPTFLGDIGTGQIEIRRGGAFSLHKLAQFWRSLRSKRSKSSTSRGVLPRKVLARLLALSRFQITGRSPSEVKPPRAYPLAHPAARHTACFEGFEPGEAVALRVGSGLGADARVAARSCCVSWSSPERGCGIFPPGAPRTTTRRTRPGCTGSCSLGRREAGRPHNRSQKVVHLRVRAPPLFPTRTPPGRPSSRCVKVPGARIAGLLFWSLATRLSSAGS